MIFDSPLALKSSVAADQRLMGLDPGSKTIGVAISDISHGIATPLISLRRSRFRLDAQKLAAIVTDHEVGGVIIGLPVRMDGTEGPASQSVRQFAKNLDAVLALPMAFWDERLSTAAVERVLIEQADLTRKRRAHVIDRAAAAYILQGALDYMST